MKVLYIGCYRDGTGWAYAAQNYILSLDMAGVDVVPRCVKLNKNEGEIPNRIKELEKKSEKGCDVVIQHVLPHHSDFNGNFDKNISLYVAETDHCKNTCWPERINLMDQAWVPNNFMAKQFSVNSKIFTPHYVVPHACDVSKYQKDYEKLEIPFIENKFVFYFIGEINRRKNISAVMKAFHTEFSIAEDVALVIKAHLPGHGPNESEQHLRQISDGVKEGLKLYSSKDLYHPEVFICDYMTDAQIMRLHATCDCFVSASFGEAWGIPIFDAMAMGKTPICGNSFGPKDFLQGCGYLVECREENCFGMMDTFDELYVGDESWFSPSIIEIRKKMRQAFENTEERNAIIRNGVERAYDYSYSSVGNIMKSILNDEHDSPLCTEQEEFRKSHERVQ